MFRFSCIPVCSRSCVAFFCSPSKELLVVLRSMTESRPEAMSQILNKMRTQRQRMEREDFYEIKSIQHYEQRVEWGMKLLTWVAGRRDLLTAEISKLDGEIIQIENARAMGGIAKGVKEGLRLEMSKWCRLAEMLAKEKEKLTDFHCTIDEAIFGENQSARTGMLFTF